MMKFYSVMIPLLLAACSSTPTLYHSLNVTVADARVAAETSQRVRSLGVGPMNLPTLLDREGMVIRKNATTLAVSDTHLWGGQLEDELLDALTQHLQQRLPATRVQRIPWELSQTPQYQVVVKLTQFDAMPNASAVLVGSWQLQAGNDGIILQTQPLRLVRQVAGAGVDALLESQSQLVAELADNIVHGLAAR